jgi:hypothetical protein
MMLACMTEEATMPLPTLPHPGFGAAAAAVLLACLGTPAQAGVDISLGLNFPIGHHGHHHHGHRGSVYTTLPRGAVSVTIGGGRYWRHGGAHYRPWGPNWVMVAPPVVLAAPMVVETVRADPPLPVAPSKPDPVIYPRNGQNAQQTEADRQECNRWATTQPAALADASVFHRAVEACMDGRGYSMK